MIYDYKNAVIKAESPGEDIDHKKHMAEYGPVMGKSHPDNCPYCAARGWKTFPGTSFAEECEKYREEHPEEFEK